MSTVRATRRERWSWPGFRRTDEQRANGAAFLDAAAKFILHDRRPDECPEFERLVWRVAVRLHEALTGDDDPEHAVAVRNSLFALGGDPSPNRRRAYCSQAIVAWATHWREARWQQSAETRKRCLAGLVQELASHDRAFDVLALEHRALAAFLDGWDPDRGPEAGGKSAERILAEIIVTLLDAKGALELAARTGEKRDTEIERLRTVIEQDTAEATVELEALETRE
jgi:hypothetical protein